MENMFKKYCPKIEELDIKLRKNKAVVQTTRIKNTLNKNENKRGRRTKKVTFARKYEEKDKNENLHDAVSELDGKISCLQLRINQLEPEEVKRYRQVLRHKHARITHLKEKSLQNKMASKFLMMEQKLRHTENILEQVVMSKLNETTSKKRLLTDIDEAYINSIVVRPDNENSIFNSTIDVEHIYPFSNGVFKDQTKSLDRSFALTLVFSRLTSTELLRCALVCSEWKRLSRNPNLWKIINFKNIRLAPELLVLSSSWSSKCKSLSLKNVTFLNTDVRKKGSNYCLTIGSLDHALELLLKSCGSNLARLCVEDCGWSITSKCLWAASCHNPNLKTVTYRSSFDPLSCQVANSFVSRCRGLTTLEIAPSLNRKPTSSFSYDDEVIILISWCLPNLQAFSYGGLLTGCRSLKAIATNCQQLRVLELVNSAEIKNETANYITQYGFKSLKTMLLSRTVITKKALQKLIEELPNIEYIQITLNIKAYTKNTRFSEDAYEEFINKVILLKKYSEKNQQKIRLIIL